jgi:hypothetical protein
MEPTTCVLSQETLTKLELLVAAPHRPWIDFSSSPLALWSLVAIVAILVARTGFIVWRDYY